MPSPFPGMDPYLEDPALWPGMHQSLITYMRDSLNPAIRPTYNARIGERLYVVQAHRDIYPDVTLLQRPGDQPAPVDAPGAVVESIAEPVAPYIVTILPTEHREPFIEIVHSASGDVVTVIEILSPANKVGEGYNLYRQKQMEILKSTAHLVEIDLLSQGQHALAMPIEGRLKIPAYRYLICVSRATDRRYQFETYPFLLKDPLPPFRIPLRPPDPDTVLNLQIIFNQSYDNGGYEDFVDYTAPPRIPLPEAEKTEALNARPD
jgi:hypothetical protein